MKIKAVVITEPLYVVAVLEEEIPLWNRGKLEEQIAFIKRYLFPDAEIVIMESPDVDGRAGYYGQLEPTRVVQRYVRSISPAAMPWQEYGSE